MFIVYGATGDHLDRYIDYYGNRKDVKEALRLAGTSQTINERANALGVRHKAN